MRLQDAASTDFLLVDQRQSAGRVADLLRTTRAASVVAAIDDSHAFLWRASEILPQLAERPLERAFVLLAADADPARQVPIVDTDLPADAVPDRCVVAEDAVVTGVYDARLVAARARSGAILAGRQTRGGTDHLPRTDPKTALCELQAEFPPGLGLGETRSLLVSVLRPVGGVDPIANLPDGSAIDVILQARQGFEVLGRSEMRLRFADDDDALPVRFQVRASLEGIGKLRVLSFP